MGLVIKSNILQYTRLCIIKAKILFGQRLWSMVSWFPYEGVGTRPFTGALSHVIITCPRNRIMHGLVGELDPRVMPNQRCIVSGYWEALPGHNTLGTLWPNFQPISKRINYEDTHNLWPNRILTSTISMQNFVCCKKLVSIMRPTVHEAHIEWTYGHIMRQLPSKTLLPYLTPLYVSVYVQRVIML